MSTLIIDTVDIVDTVEAGTTLGSVTINLKNANQLISIMGLRDASASKNQIHMVCSCKYIFKSLHLLGPHPMVLLSIKGERYNHSPQQNHCVKQTWGKCGADNIISQQIFEDQIL